MNVAFILQYYPYQYEQFLPLIRALHADAFYRIHSDNQSKYYNSKVFRVEDGTPVHYKNFEQDHYDCIVYTGTWCASLNKFADRCKFKDILYMSHSLIGSLYDIGIVTPSDVGREIGFVPDVWTTFPSFEKRCEIIREEKGYTDFVVTKTHPIAAQALTTPRQTIPDSRTLGVILGHKSPFPHFSEIVDDLVKTHGFAKVKIKLHPLTDDSVAKEFFDKPYIEILPKDYDKYQWLDSCGYIIGGCSSLLIEELLRAMYFRTGQKFKQFPFKRRGIPLSIEGHESVLWSLDAPEFRDFAVDPIVIIDEHITTLERVLNKTEEIHKIDWREYNEA